MKVISVTHYRDGSTGSIMTIQEDGTKVEYLVHSMNWGNTRTDVTKRQYLQGAETLPVDQNELIRLINAFRDYVREAFKDFDDLDKYKVAEYYSMTEAFMVTCEILMKKVRP